MHFMPKKVYFYMLPQKSNIFRKYENDALENWRCYNYHKKGFGKHKIILFKSLDFKET